MPSWDIYLVISGPKSNLPKHAYKGDINQVKTICTKKNIKEFSKVIYHLDFWL